MTNRELYEIGSDAENRADQEIGFGWDPETIGLDVEPITPESVRLEDCPGGLFVFNNVTYLRTTTAEAYDCRDGSAFWTHPELFIGSSKADDDHMKSLCDLMVRPITS